ncbi:MAG: hypothetical protein QM740_05225 [Acidovorax sp.]
MYRWSFTARTVGACLALALLLLGSAGAAAQARTLRYFPAGPIYEYRWKLLELALERAPKASGAAYRLEPYGEDVSQNRGVSLLQSGAIQVIALGTNREREAAMLPIKIDILRGIIGYRVCIIDAADQERIARMNDTAFREQLTFGLNSQWADLTVMRANGYTVMTTTDYERLFGMLAAHRFDALPRGLNEAELELGERRAAYPQLAIEKTRALFFPYPVYFWVNKEDAPLARRIEQGLRAALADGSFRRLFETYHASAIAAMAKEKRRVVRLDNPVLPPGTAQVDTSWWWR